MDSQLYKARILELLGKREEALATLAACFQRGATDVQVAAFPDLQSLRKDPRYRQLAEAKSIAAAKQCCQGRYVLSKPNGYASVGRAKMLKSWPERVAWQIQL